MRMVGESRVNDSWVSSLSNYAWIVLPFDEVENHRE